MKPWASSPLSVAHDFNNLLTPIMGCLDIIRRRTPEDDRHRRLVESALQSAQRARTLIQHLLAFARRQPLQPVAVDIPQLLMEMSALIATSRGPRIGWRSSLTNTCRRHSRTATRSRWQFST